jgi:hypothetical protein
MGIDLEGANACSHAFFSFRRFTFAVSVIVFGFFETLATANPGGLDDLDLLP